MRLPSIKRTIIVVVSLSMLTSVVAGPGDFGLSKPVPVPSGHGDFGLSFVVPASAVLA